MKRCEFFRPGWPGHQCQRHAGHDGDCLVWTAEGTKFFVGGLEPCEPRRMPVTSFEAEIERLHTWQGLMSLLDEHYPATVFDGSSGDPGARIVALIREVDRLREFTEIVVALCVPMAPPADEGPMPPVMAKVLLSLAETAMAGSSAAAVSVLKGRET